MIKMIKSEEPLKIKIFERITPPEKDECFLLYRKNYDRDSFVIIMPDGKYSSAEIRQKKCDRKVTLYTGVCKFNEQYKIDMVNKLFSYEIRISFEWQINSVSKFFFEEKFENDELSRRIRMLVLKENRQWDNNQVIELQQVMEIAVESLLKEYSSIDFTGIRVEVEQDAEAEKCFANKKETYMELQNMSNQELIDEHKKEVLEKNINRYGLSGLDVMDLLKGRISEGELRSRLQAADKERMEKINYAYEKDFISHEMASKSMQESINGIGLTHDVYKIDSKDETKEKLNLEECPADEDTL